jgi:hypothetical protein
VANALYPLFWNMQGRAPGTAAERARAAECVALLRGCLGQFEPHELEFWMCLARGAGCEALVRALEPAPARRFELLALVAE